MNAMELARSARCGACGGRIDRVNLCTLGYRASWKFPVAGNVITGETGRAIAILCDPCIEALMKLRQAAESHLPIREAVEFREDRVIYHPLETLEPMPREKTYVLINGGIQCLRCGAGSMDPDDVEQKFCAVCGQFHQE